MADRASYLYLGLAGETGPGRVVDTGLFRLADGGNEWEALQRGLPEKARGARPRGASAKAGDRLRRHTIRPLSQRRPRRALGEGEMPDHGLPVWSILFHPHNPDVILIGCDNCEIYRSDDAGEHWTRLPVSVRFPRSPPCPAPTRPSAY